MKLDRNFWVSVLLAAFTLAALFPQGLQTASAAIGVPRILNHQGRLYNASGTLLGGAGTEYCFRFSLYDDGAVGGGDVKLWPTSTPATMTTTVRNGIFSVGVGDIGAGGDALDFDFESNDSVYLQTDVATKVGATCAPGDGAEAFETLNPRQRVVASGFAVNAATVGGFLPSQAPSGTSIPVLSSGNLTLAGTNPQVNATSTNTLTLQGGTGTGNIQFFSAANFLTSTGTLTLAGTLNALNINQYLRTTSSPTFAGLTLTGPATSTVLQLTASSNQLVFQSGGATGTISWTPSSGGKILTIPDFSSSTETAVVTGFAQTLSNKTLIAPQITSGATLIQDTVATGFSLTQNSAATALLITNAPTSTQATSTVAITAGSNVTGAALLITNFGSGNALEVRDATTTVVFRIDGNGSAFFAPRVDATSTFLVQNASTTETLLTVDTTNNDVVIGNNSAAGTPTTLFGLDKKSDAGDPTGFDGAMYYSSSSGRFRCYEGGAWANCTLQDLEFQPHFTQRRWGYAKPAGSTASSLTVVGLAAIVVNGTAAASGQADDYYVQWTSAGTNGSVGGITQTFIQTQGRYRPRLATRIRTDSTIDNRRIWVGLTSATLTASDGTGALTTRYVGVRYSTAAGDTTWQCASGDGTTGSATSTGVTVATSTSYDILIDWSVDGQLTCGIGVSGGAYVNTVKTTNLDTTQTANLGMINALTTLTAAARVHRISYIYLGDKN